MVNFGKYTVRPMDSYGNGPLESDLDFQIASDVDRDQKFRKKRTPATAKELPAGKLR